MKTHLIIIYAIGVSIALFQCQSASAQKTPVHEVRIDCDEDFNTQVDEIFKMLESQKLTLTWEEFKHRQKVSAELIETCACRMVARRIQVSQYGIATSWLFKKDHIKDLLDSSGVYIHGIRFYAAINKSIPVNGTDYPALTLVASPVRKHPLWGNYNDYREYKLYEYAQICPPYCKQFETPNPVLNTQSSFSVPESWYIAKADLESILNNNSVNFLKLIRRIITVNGDEIMDLSIVGTDTDLNHTEIGTVLKDKTVICPGECTIISNAICH